MSVPYRANKAHRLAVQTLLSADVPLWKIAKQLGIGEETLRRHYPQQLERAGLINGRKPHEPTPDNRKKVWMLAGMQVANESIAKFLDIGDETLRKHYSEDIERGRIEANLKVGMKLFEMATGPAELKTTATAAIFWAKTKMGFVETSRVEQTGKEGGPVEHAIQIVLPDNSRGDVSPALMPAIEQNLADIAAEIDAFPEAEPESEYDDD
jgi:hypothetical protein